MDLQDSEERLIFSPPSPSQLKKTHVWLELSVLDLDRSAQVGRG
jgi:hypothetical protein